MTDEPTPTPTIVSTAPIGYMSDKTAVVAQTVRQIRGLLKKIEGVLDIPVASSSNTPTRLPGRPPLSDEARVKRRSILIHEGVIRRAYRAAERVIREPPDLTVFSSVLTWAVNKRLVKDYDCEPHIEPSEEREQEVRNELSALPPAAVTLLTRDRFTVWPDDGRFLAAIRQVEEDEARKEITGFGVAHTPERKALEKAFAKKFGHRP
jgi:hypothetical protein